jgi:diacylglycerol kinase (ATP)
MDVLHQLYSGFQNSINGLKIAWKEDHSFRHSTWNVIIAAILATILTELMERNVYFWLLLVGSTFPIIIVEAINTAIEAVTDKASPEHSKLAKKAKDIGSASVLLTRLLAAICWVVVIFSPDK